MKISTAVSIGITGAFAGAYAFAVRPWFLGWGSTCEERRISWPGDDLASHPRTVSMRGITIDAQPEQVWPWIMQIGQDRAGFYSYQQLENAAGAQFQHRYVSDTVWLSAPRTYGGRGKLIVAYYEKNRAMILVSVQDWERLLLGRPIVGGTWGFIVRPAPGGKTRFIMRSVSSAAPFSREHLLGYTWELAHFIMERRMMKHLKKLVEESNASRVVLETIEIEVEPA